MTEGDGIIQHRISIIVPAFNEEATIRPLYEQIVEVAELNGLEYELLFVDDGSSDRTWQEIERLASSVNQVIGVRHGRNRGKAAALAQGFRLASLPVVFQMDADLQDDPREIPRFLNAIESGKDLVNGWKVRRLDPWHKTLPSKVFNRFVSYVFGLRLQDHNCGFKCMRSAVAKSLVLYGELHRFIPVLAHMEGWRIAEIEVHHRSREHGTSKYGVERFMKGFLDVLAVAFVTGYGRRPFHVFGAFGLGLTGVGAIGLIYLIGVWVYQQALVENPSAIGNRPLLLYSLGAFISGIQVLMGGLLAELVLSLQMRRTVQPAADGVTIVGCPVESGISTSAIE